MCVFFSPEFDENIDDSETDSRFSVATNVSKSSSVSDISYGCNFINLNCPLFLVVCETNEYITILLKQSKMSVID